MELTPLQSDGNACAVHLKGPHVFLKQIPYEMNYPKPIKLKETDSTNLYMSRLCDRQKQADFTCVCSDYQTAGRGQRGNGWESEAGKNLLFSFVLYPDSLEASRQFVLSQITALALQETLAQYADDITVKWPNDIYWKDRKLCGTLIENDLTGLYVSRSISGTGVNLNQERFLSGAPNPVSLHQITGCIYRPEEVLRQILDRAARFYGMLRAGRTSEIADKYKECLFRKDGFHPYKDSDGPFMARIADIEPSGRMALEDERGRIRKYMFKEVEYTGIGLQNAPQP